MNKYHHILYVPCCLCKILQCLFIFLFIFQGMTYVVVELCIVLVNAQTRLEYAVFRLPVCVSMDGFRSMNQDENGHTCPQTRLQIPGSNDNDNDNEMYLFDHKNAISPSDSASH